MERNSRQGIRQRVFRGTIASMMAFSTKVLIGLIQVPAMFYLWGATRFGEWLLLYSFVSYFLLLDFGFSASAGNLISNKIASGSIKKAQVYFTAAFLAITTLAIIGSASVVLIWTYFSDSVVAKFNEFSGNEVYYSFYFLVVASVLLIYTNFLGNILKSVGRYAEQTMISVNGNAIDILFMILSAAISKNIFIIVSALIISRAFLLIIALVMVKKYAFQVVVFRKSKIYRNIKLMLPSSVAFSLFPVTNALSLNGVSMVIGLTLGPVNVAIVTAYRTLARLIDIVPDLFSAVITAEAAYCRGRKDSDLLVRIGIVGTLVNLILSIFGLLVISILGEYIFLLWANGVEVYWPFILFLLLAARVLRAIYLPCASIINGLNRHFKLGVASVFIHLAGVIFLYVVLDGESDIYIVCSVLIFIEIVLLFLVFLIYTKIIKSNLTEFFKDLFSKYALILVISRLKTLLNSSRFQ